MFVTNSITPEANRRVGALAHPIEFPLVKLLGADFAATSSPERRCAVRLPGSFLPISVAVHYK
jgi:hypothetical protein